MTRGQQSKSRPLRAEDREKARKRLEKLAWLLDNSIPIPGLNYRIGLDGFLGFLPGFGDTLGAALSSVILAEASRLGVPKAVLVKMAVNVALDALLGVVPVFGDIFDFAWKANQKNVELLEQYVDHPRETVFSSRLLAWGLGVGLVGFVMFIGFLSLLMVRGLWELAAGGG